MQVGQGMNLNKREEKNVVVAQNTENGLSI